MRNGIVGDRYRRDQHRRSGLFSGGGRLPQAIGEDAGYGYEDLFIQARGDGLE